MRCTLFALFLFATPLLAQTKTPPLPKGADKGEYNLAYGKHERQKLDIFVPKGDGPFPLVIWIHGGGWEAGNKDTNPALELLAKGFAVAGANYRLSQHAPFPAQIEDCKAAVRYLRANAKKYNLDEKHFGVWGASAGGHLVALLGTAGNVKELEGEGDNLKVSSKVQAVIDWFGPTDLLKMTPENAPATHPIVKLVGGPLKEKSKLAEQANPIKYISKETPPFLIIHGDKDTLVPLNQSEILHEAIKKAGVESELVVIKNAGHGGKDFLAALDREKMITFLEKHLKPKK